MLSAAAKKSSLRCITAFGSSGASFLSQRGFAAGTSRVVELQSGTDYQQALAEQTATSGAAVYNFTAKWCGPCKMMAPLYEKLSAELHPHVRFYMIDIENEELRKAVQENNVVGVPNFSFYLAGEKVGAFRGAKKEQLLGSLQQLQAAQQEMAQPRADGLLLA